MAIDFPNSPNVNDTYTVDDKTFIWTGDYWRVLNSPNYISTLIKDADNDTKVEVEQSADEDTVRITTGGTERYSIGTDGHIIPTANETYDLGSATNRFRDLYLSGTSIDLGGVSITSDGSTLSLPEASLSGGTVDGDLTVTGDLTVSGTTTEINTTELLVEDNLVTLNSGATGSPTLDSGIEVERGDEPNVAIKWSEADDMWHYTNDGTLYDPIGTPAGAIIQYGGTAEPQGWLLCDGREVSRTTYARLFASLGGVSSYPYGLGNGTSTFNLPNMKGKVPVGRDSGDTAFDDLGETGGAKTHTLTTGEMPSHTHTQNSHTHTINHGHSITDPGHTHTLEMSYGSGSNPDVLYGYGIQSTVGTRSKTTGISVNNHSGSSGTATATNQNTGGGTAHNNLQPYIVVNYLIKV